MSRRGEPLTEEGLATLRANVTRGKGGGMCKAEVRSADGPRLKVGRETLPKRKPAGDSAMLWPGAFEAMGRFAEWRTCPSVRAFAPSASAATGLTWYVAEYRFAPSRGWAFDWAVQGRLVAVEVDGGRFALGGGRHASDGDRQKLNEAAAMGWRVLRFSARQLREDPAGCIDVAERAIGWRP